MATASVLTKKQVKKFGPVKFSDGGKNFQITAEARYDDECGNGHNSFSLTADIHLCDVSGKPVRWDGGGCCHDEIAQHFPSLAPLIKWHLCSSDGPMHYLQNTLFFASERDCWGKLAGEPYDYQTSIHFGENPIKHKFGKRFTTFLTEAKSHPGSEKFDFEVIAVPHEKRTGEDYDFAPKYTFGGFDARWHECPFDTETEALDFLQALQTCNPQFVSVPTQWGKGKARELDNARGAAIWPEATDEELSAPDLKEKLEARLPALLAEFQKAVESLGFTF